MAVTLAGSFGIGSVPQRQTQTGALVPARSADASGVPEASDSTFSTVGLPSQSVSTAPATASLRAMLYRAQPFDERSTVRDKFVHKPLAEHVFDWKPLPCHWHHRQFVQGGNASEVQTESRDHHHVDVVGRTPQRQRRLE